jgi:hypothetical protein
MGRARVKPAASTDRGARPGAGVKTPGVKTQVTRCPLAAANEAPACAKGALQGAAVLVP